jgi:hypothetical protein
MDAPTLLELQLLSQYPTRESQECERDRVRDLLVLHQGWLDIELRRGLSWRLITLERILDEDG